MTNPIIAQHIAAADDLVQAGVKGMKWGFRKRPDGTVAKTGRTAKGSADHQKAQALKGKKLSDMSNDEIKELSKRLELEKKYRELNPNVIRRGQQLVSTISGVANSARQADAMIQMTPQGRALRTQLLLRTARAASQLRK